MLVFPLDVEILGHRSPVVRGDEVAYHLRQMVFLGQSQPFAHVADDNFRRPLFCELVVRVHARLVLREESRVEHLADVVVECARSDELRLRANLVSHFRCQVGHLQGVDKCALCHLRHAPEDGIVRVRQLYERHAAGKAEQFLNHVHQRVGKEQEYAVDAYIYI